MKEGRIQLFFCFLSVFLYAVRPSVRPHGLCPLGTASTRKLSGFSLPEFYWRSASPHCNQVGLCAKYDHCRYTALLLVLDA